MWYLYPKKQLTLLLFLDLIILFIFLVLLTNSKCTKLFYDVLIWWAWRPKTFEHRGGFIAEGVPEYVAVVMAGLLVLMRYIFFETFKWIVHHFVLVLIILDF